MGNSFRDPWKAAGPQYAPELCRACNAAVPGCLMYSLPRSRSRRGPFWRADSHVDDCRLHELVRSRLGAGANPACGREAGNGAEARHRSPGLDLIIAHIRAGNGGRGSFGPAFALVGP